MRVIYILCICIYHQQTVSQLVLTELVCFCETEGSAQSSEQQISLVDHAKRGSLPTAQAFTLLQSNLRSEWPWHCLQHRHLASKTLQGQYSVCLTLEMFDWWLMCRVVVHVMLGAQNVFFTQRSFVIVRLSWWSFMFWSSSPSYPSSGEIKLQEWIIEQDGGLDRRTSSTYWFLGILVARAFYQICPLTIPLQHPKSKIHTLASHLNGAKNHIWCNTFRFVVTYFRYKYVFYISYLC